jgi:hypothetical protein
MRVVMHVPDATPVNQQARRRLIWCRNGALLLQARIITGRRRHGRRCGIGRHPAAQHHHDGSYREISFHIVQSGWHLRAQTHF